MSKEVLYRAVSKKGKWIYGFYYCHKGLNEHFILPIDETPFYNGIPIVPKAISDYEVYKETVSEFTGLTDKNGTKIFEGDIVQSITEDTHEKRFAVIKFGKYKDDNFEDSAIGFYFECGGYQFSMFNGEAQGYDFPSFVEVIGNIHDNPELLEEV